MLQSLFGNVIDSKDFLPFQERDDYHLPELGSPFSIPALPEKPQNPILDSVNIVRSGRVPSSPLIRTDELPQELAVLTTACTDPLLDRSPDTFGFWQTVLSSRRRLENQALFWDRMCPEAPSDAPTSTPFISEQDDMVYSIARHQLQHPSVESSGIHRTYLTQSEFLTALQSTVLGTSSSYHIWDAEQERFVYVRAPEGRQGCIIVDGKDEVICQSVAQRFLTIGTLIRRLETLLVALRARSAREGPTIHAFAHSLSTILAFLRDDISRCSAETPFQDQHLSAIWGKYASYEEILIALSSFYGRSEDIPPEDYLFLGSAPVPLLNRTYNELRWHMEHHSSRVIIAIFAFILTKACSDYLREICHTVGYGVTYIKKSAHVVGERPDQYATDEVEEEENTNDIFDAMEKLSTEFPSFFPQELVDVLPAAQKSLILLQEAQPDHPILASPQGWDPIRWFWKREDIEAAWKRSLPGEETLGSESQPAPLGDAPSSILYKPELAQFKIFDQEPGFYHQPSALKSESASVMAFRTFINDFPERLPPVTPTLPLLASLVFSNLVEHASKLSGALLKVFLSSADNLNLRAHLELLRSFLLVTSPAFESRLSAALFSDVEEYELDIKSNRMSLYSLRRRPSKKVVPGTQPWAVGLAAALLDRETWPPVEADLGFFLRTVIVDSIGEDENETADEGEKVKEEAEYRLGFAIRDLPAGSGKEKWLNPLTIEALDFLYMDYKPPHALEVLITPDIMSKYQRMFAFILRLMRVTHAIKAVYRMCCASSTPLFETLVKFRQATHHFRFVAHSFVSNLLGYVFDTAIGGNFDPFVERLAATASLPSTSSSTSRVPSPTAGFHPNLRTTTERFSDVFSLSQSHSDLLDNILSACLLRSGQREVGDILRQALELVLEFSVVIGELHRGRLEEYEAGPMIMDLFSNFRAKMTMFTRILKELAEKMGGNSSIGVAGEDGHEGRRRAAGGMEALSHLMIKLEIRDWWTQA